MAKRGRAASIFRAFANVVTLLFLVVSIPLTCGIYAKAFVDAGSKARFPPPGQVVDIGGGEKIHLRVWGTANSKPTLLMYVSCCSVSSAWAWIAQGLDADYRVVAVDRPGMGWSSGGVGPRDAEHAARALQSALSVAGIGPPYVVVAHSYGGFAARVFTAENRTDVRALILLDTSHPDAPGAGYGFFARIDALKANAGLRLLDPPETGFDPLPPADAAAANAVSHWASQLDAVADELETWDRSGQEVRDAGTFDDLPVLIVAANEDERERQYELDMLKLSRQAQFVALNVGHSEMLVREDQAALTTAEIRKFLAAAVP